MDLIRITDPKSKAKVKVASGSVVPVVGIGDLTLTDLSDFVFESVEDNLHYLWNLAQHPILRMDWTQILRSSACARWRFGWHPRIL